MKKLERTIIILSDVRSLVASYNMVENDISFIDDVLVSILPFKYASFYKSHIERIKGNTKLYYNHQITRYFLDLDGHTNIWSIKEVWDKLFKSINFKLSKLGFELVDNIEVRCLLKGWEKSL